MTFLCANCILYHNWFEMKPGLCCSCCEPCAPKSKCAQGGCDRLCAFDDAKCKAHRSTTIAAETGPTETSKKPCMVRFFEDIFPFQLIVKNKAMALFSIVLCLCTLLAMALTAKNIEPQTTTENFLPDDHPFQRNIAVNNNFAASNFDTTVEINLVWGFVEGAPLDTTGVNLIFDADFKGRPNYAPGFELTPAAQVTRRTMAAPTDPTYHPLDLSDYAPSDPPAAVGAS